MVSLHAGIGEQAGQIWWFILSEIERMLGYQMRDVRLAENRIFRSGPEHYSGLQYVQRQAFERSQYSGRYR